MMRGLTPYTTRSGLQIGSNFQPMYRAPAMSDDANALQIALLSKDSAQSADSKDAYTGLAVWIAWTLFAILAFFTVVHVWPAP